jgi:peptide/nickel transport system substrate-binding protein
MKRMLAAVLVALVTSSVAGCFATNPEADDPSDRQRLRVGLVFPPRKQLSPYTDDAAILTLLGTAEPLVRVDRGGRPAPVLAESWSQPDASSVRLTLRRGVTFHDGTPLTAVQAADSVNRAAAAKPVPRALVDITLTAVAVDESVLEVRTTTPDPTLLQRLATPQLVILAPRAYQQNPAGPDPVGAGTGPYRLTSVQGVSAVTLERYDRYWGGRPQLAGLDVRFLPDGAARAGGLRAGELDLVNALPVAQLPNIQEQRVIEVALPRTVSLYLVGTPGRVFADPGLRAAARAATDPAAISASIYEGRADPAEGLFGPASSWAAPGRAAARSAAPPLPAAGTPKGTRITLATYTDRPELPEMASALAAAFGKRGFVVDTVVREYSTLEPDVLAGRFDAVIVSRSYVFDTADPVAFIRADFTCSGSYNVARFCDPRFDRRVGAAAALTDLPARLTATLNLEAEILNRVVVVPLTHERARLGASHAVTGLAEDPYERTLITVRTDLK